MPTRPTIPKELILKNALVLLITEGYENVNIKSIANKIVFSTVTKSIVNYGNSHTSALTIRLLY